MSDTLSAIQREPQPERKAPILAGGRAPLDGSKGFEGVFSLSTYGARALTLITGRPLRIPSPLRFELDANEDRAAGLWVLLFSKALVGEAFGEGFFAARFEVAGVAPCFPGGEEVAGEGVCSGIEDAFGAFGQPLAKRVLVFEVAAGRVADDVGRVEADAFPFQGAVDAPSQDGPAFLLPELVGQVRVAFVFWDLDGERDEQEAAAHGFVDVVESRFVISDDEQFEGWSEVEIVLSHVAGGDLVATRECLDLGFVPASSFLRFLCDDEACAVELGEVGGVTLGIAGDEGVHVGDGGVVAEDPGDGVDE